MKLKTLLESRSLIRCTVGGVEITSSTTVWDQDFVVKELHLTSLKGSPKYLPEGRAGLPKAQNELIDTGLEDYAQI